MVSLKLVNYFTVKDPTKEKRQKKQRKRKEKKEKRKAKQYSKELNELYLSENSTMKLPCYTKFLRSECNNYFSPHFKHDTGNN